MGIRATFFKALAEVLAYIPASVGRWEFVPGLSPTPGNREVFYGKWGVEFGRNPIMGLTVDQAWDKVSRVVKSGLQPTDPDYGIVLALIDELEFKVNH